MLEVVDAEVLNRLREIRALIEDGTMSDALKLEGIRGILDRDQSRIVDCLRADIRKESNEMP